MGEKGRLLLFTGVRHEEPPALRHCPFCGSDGVYGRRNGLQYVCCPEGCASSPDFSAKHDAGDWWNRRPKRRTSLKNQEG